MTEDFSEKKNLSGECLSFPNEVLIDIFSFLPRKILIKNIEPVNEYFFIISKQNVKSIHLIQENEDFINKLAYKQTEANQQYSDLIQSKCPLNEHFRLKFVWNVYICRRELYQANFKRRRRYQMCVMRHSLDIFQNCYVRVTPYYTSVLESTDLQEIYSYLNILDSANPSQIDLFLPMSYNRLPLGLRICPFTQELLNNQTILNCQKLKIIHSDRNEPEINLLFNWLHYKRNNNFNNKNRYRLLITLKTETIFNGLDELIEKCKKNLLQSESANDHQSYIFGFLSPKDLTEFTLENTKSEELIFLENLKSGNGTKTNYYWLRRCNKIMENNQKEYCQKISKNSFSDIGIIYDEYYYFNREKPLIRIY